MEKQTIIVLRGKASKVFKALRKFRGIKGSFYR